MEIICFGLQQKLDKIKYFTTKIMIIKIIIFINLRILIIQIL